MLVFEKLITEIQLPGYMTLTTLEYPSPVRVSRTNGLVRGNNVWNDE